MSVDVNNVEIIVIKFPRNTYAYKKAMQSSTLYHSKCHAIFQFSYILFIFKRREFKFISNPAFPITQAKIYCFYFNNYVNEFYCHCLTCIRNPCAQ